MMTADEAARGADAHVLSLQEEVATFIREGPRYLVNRARGKSYLTYQARRYDRLWRRDPRHFSSADRTFQLSYCRAHGLTRAMRLLDFGCGPLAAGIHFIEYLDEGNYAGADISREALRLGREAVAARGLASKRPQLIVLPDSGSLDALAGRRFDVVWAQSVLTHMAPADVVAVARALPSILAPGGQFLASFYLSSRGVRRRAFKDWSYDAAFVAGLGREAGLRADILDDFNHPRPIVRRDEAMVVLRLRHEGR